MFLKKLFRSNKVPISKENEEPQVTSSWRKFTLLMWKNWLLQWRHKIQSVAEILIPVLFSALLVLIRSLVDPKEFPLDTRYQPIVIDDLKLLPINNDTTPSIDFRLFYSPQNDVLDEFVKRVADNLSLPYKGVENSTRLEQALSFNNPYAGIDFSNEMKTITKLPQHLTYALRFPGELRSAPPAPLWLNWFTDLMFPNMPAPGPRSPNSQSGGIPSGYYDEGFITLQNAISSQFLYQVTNITALPKIMLQRYPYPAHIRDYLLSSLSSFVALIILLSFVYPCINTVKFIATEKENQLKEAMKIMGLSNWLHWCAWFIKSMAMLLISISFIVILLRVSWYPDTKVSVFTYSNWLLLWLFLVIYGIATVMYCFMLSVFFSKANTASAVAGLVWFITFSPYTFTEQNYNMLSLSQKLAVCLFSNTGMAYGFRLIVGHEGNGEGLQWSNLWSPVTVDDTFVVGHVVIMLFIAAVLYLMIALYVEKVMPGEFGIPEPWYFPVTRKFWCGASEYRGVHDVGSASNQIAENMEDDPTGKYAGIQVRGLRKVYANKKVAVEGLTMNMFEDQITVLLGHNGAGKTTTMSMLTGMFPPSTGTALIDSKDIITNIDGVRMSLGLCPQHNILFDELTVREHIIFFSTLKGLNTQQIEIEIEKYVRLLELEPKIDAASSTLSGGMKRKLSVGVALCGGSKVVLCDEPSSGMDPAARRALWDLIQSEKKGRTILLSTHFMDEADVLGDRIAIMADGVLRCYGSPFFLKKKFGIGYHLICVKDTNCRVSDVTELLQRFEPDAKVETNIGTELSYQLPDKNVDKFQDMLSDLEKESASLGILSYGISLTTLDEVFMKMGTDPSIKEDSTENDQVAGSVKPESNGSFSVDEAPERLALLHGAPLRFNQFVAMILKKGLFTMRNWVLFLIQNVIPVAFVIITIIIVRTWAGGNDLPPLKISMDTYIDTVTVLERNESVAPGSSQAKFADSYRDLFKNVPPQRRLVEITQDIPDYILELSRTILSRINSQYLIGASFRTNETIAWFNNQPYHSAPMSLNFIYNAMLKTECGDKCGLDVINQPMPYTFSSRLMMLQAGNNMGFQLASNVGFAMSFVAAFYILFYVKERVSRAKHLQFVSGVNVMIFWLTSLLWDFITFLVTIILILITLAIYQEEGWSSTSELARMSVLLMFFGWAMLPMIYLASMLFTIPSTGFTRMTMFSIFTGVAMFFVVFIMAFEAFELQHVSRGLTWLFLAFPHFALVQGLNNMNIMNVAIPRCTENLCISLNIPAEFCTKEMLCKMSETCCVTNYFDWEAPGSGRNIVYMFLFGAIAFCTLLLIEYRILEAIIYKGRNLISSLPESEDGFVDDDVKREKEAIKNKSVEEIKTMSLVIKDMTKMYGKFTAVNQLSVGVQAGECFGLLGVNGAGKTSTFKMLTGDEKITSGEAWVRGISLKKDMNSVHQNIGYCPQFDALLEDLTGRETLFIYCLLRGVEKPKIRALSIELARNLNFLKYLDKKVSQYSGGNKRKLSTAISLIGNPIVVYLDEPTTGMDPSAKRQLWEMVCRVRATGKSIVLTSHSMEECEALCTRLAIMVNGEFKCIGSTQQLKNKFSKGYVLVIKVAKTAGPNQMAELKAEVERVREYFAIAIPGAVLKEDYQGLLNFAITTTDLKWSAMFGIMEEAKKVLRIEDYSLSQTSLEQVFLSFTKYQRDQLV